ncbi:type IV secretion system protein [Pectobacterium brasiliense]|uniref:type IV secretion system protein n=1 Tax=Pectobacterium TaxID=122277 RepID=UPI00102EDE9E|nr:MULTISPECIES: type IV secretion system protein [Pectobacterium]MBA0219792.1 type IV secretion system protein [Pectobacterium brasiliense]MBN3072465.1 type IV secretion system protein [Pectobacterium brasiliense]MBN3168229.1 type IV secretion system protein [Pectobacterium brasiliense]TAJ06208.1 type IV secretion system protein [Pectobacterium versatile]
MGIVSDFVAQTKSLVMDAVASNFSLIATSIRPVFIAAFLLYCVVIAWMILYSNREIIIGEVIKNIIVFSLIGAFVWSAPYYQQWVVPFIMDSGSEISMIVTGNASAASGIDAMWERLITTMETFQRNATDSLGWDIGPLVSVYLIYIIGYAGGAILVTYTTIFLCISTFMTGILLSIGSVFICFSGFSATRGMFTTWCGHCLNYILLNVFYAITLSFVAVLIEKYTQLDPESISIMDSLTLLLVVVICVAMVEQVAVLCSSLTGGVGINGLVPGANSLARATGLSKAAASMRDKVSGGVAGGFKKGGMALLSKFKNNVKGG